ncbi:hypothetical protein [Cryobacterium arcticum]|uniref:Uncharacterized protein n=1 Tax=Cryobacterium arcticum TaxID=670052 RepID=A0A1B1BKJ1_9MICO|nr:hypothetical protein [Cryobacterium arcticum]ANP73038.1 hypothetical protein PA27867_2086 [Cryobacterium arcticum]
MIADSVPWREELLKIATALERRAEVKRWSTRTGFLVERDLMVGMFTIRRLVESAKTSSLLPRERVSFGMHPLTSRVPGIYDRWEYWEYYDMDSKRQTELTVRELVNLFVHSFVLEFYPQSEEGPAKIWVVSERDRHKWLYSISFARIAALFRRIGHEDVVHMEGPWDQAATRLSQHDYVDAGLARYAPYPFVETPTASRDRLVAAFPQLLTDRISSEQVGPKM